MPSSIIYASSQMLVSRLLTPRGIFIAHAFRPSVSETLGWLEDVTIDVIP